MSWPLSAPPASISPLPSTPRGSELCCALRSPGQAISLGSAFSQILHLCFNVVLPFLLLRSIRAPCLQGGQKWLPHPVAVFGFFPVTLASFQSGMSSIRQGSVPNILLSQRYRLTRKVMERLSECPRGAWRRSVSWNDLGFPSLVPKGFVSREAEFFEN